jgi:hypothetical protein
MSLALWEIRAWEQSHAEQATSLIRNEEVTPTPCEEVTVTPTPCQCQGLLKVSWVCHTKLFVPVPCLYVHLIVALYREYFGTLGNVIYPRKMPNRSTTKLSMHSLHVMPIAQAKETAQLGNLFNMHSWLKMFKSVQHRSLGCGSARALWPMRKRCQIGQQQSCQCTVYLSCQ